ncbi:hypothetical protein [Inquilinus sp. OTU3971]|uniref:hypothetical protein n=1 Tax=Inquilinus sp. OTU3971 TaxID=3043855 RepID=UPI00313C6686
MVALVGCAPKAPVSEARTPVNCNFTDDNIVLYQATMDAAYYNNPHIYKLIKAIADGKMTSAEARAKMNPNEYLTAVNISRVLKQKEAAEQRVAVLTATCNQLNN